MLETTSNVWDIYEIVDPLVRKTLVANAYKVRQIAEALKLQPVLKTPG